MYTKNKVFDSEVYSGIIM